MEINCLTILFLLSHATLTHGKPRNPMPKSMEKGKTFVPQYMKDLYDVIEKLDLTAGRDHVDIGGEIMCLLPEKMPMSRPTWKGPYFYSYSFTGYNLPSDIEKIKKVEFRAFKVTPNNFQREMPNRFYRTDIRIISQSFESHNIVLVSSTGYGWISIDLTSTFKNFLQQRRANDTKFFVVVNVSNTQEGVTPKIKFITSTTHHHRALFVVFSDANTISTDIFNAESGFTPVTHQNENACSGSNLTEVKSRKKRGLQQQRNGCRLETLYVDIGRILPRKRQFFLTRKLKINRCIGSCALPHGKNSIQETSHAELKRAHIYQSGKIGEESLCCTPKKFRHVSYQVRVDDYIYLKTFKKARVVGCYCT